MGEQGTRTIRAVDIACDILEALQRLNGAGVTELANELGHSKSTIHSHLATLVENEMVVKNGARYRLSLRHLALAEHVKEQIGNYDVIKTELDALAETTREVTQFGVAEHGRIIYLHKKKSERGVETASRVGRSQDIHSTGLGKAVLSVLPDGRVHEILDERGLGPKTANTITSRDELIEELERTRDRGFALDREENVEGIRCVAAPVEWENTVGAVSVTGPASRLQGDRFEKELPRHVRHAANVIEVNSRFQNR